MWQGEPSVNDRKYCHNQIIKNDIAIVNGQRSPLGWLLPLAGFLALKDGVLARHLGPYQGAIGHVSDQPWQLSDLQQNFAY